MFLKPYKLKSNAPLKGSDAKRLRHRLEVEFPGCSAEVIVPAKASITLLKIVLHSGLQTNVFCMDKLPMFFESDGGQLVPTLYALWIAPNLLPYFTTWQAVLPKLSNGADLMLPGIVTQGTGMNIYGRYKKGQLVAINLTSNHAAVGVGYLPRSSDDLFMSGGQGVGVKILHLFGDKLWAHEPSLVQQVPNIKPAKITSEDFPPLGAEPKKQQNISFDKPTTLAEMVVSSTTPSIEENNVTDENLPNINGLDVAAVEAENPSQSSIEINLEDILKRAFLAALKNHGKSLQLPLLTSNFYRLYVVPEAGVQIDLKKTRYKKLSNFLNEMIDHGFIVVREETKGIDKIISIDLEHPEVVNFITDYKQPTTTTNGNDQQDQPLFHSELTELYIVTDETAAFFTKLNYKRGEGIPVGQIKKIVREYINKQNLPTVDMVSKTIRLDETLISICERTEATLGTICSAITGKMEHSFQMCSGKDTTTKSKPLIQMSLATRSGNKKVTLVSNVDCYGIILSEFIKLCKQGAAASTTIVKLPHQKHELLQIQGNQVRFIYNLLTETYKVPAKCILGLELAKDGKKQKKK